MRNSMGSILAGGIIGLGGMLGVADGALTELAPGVLIASGSATLDVGQHAAPHVADWNSDGRKDLILGWFGSTVKVYLNSGSDSSPSFGSSSEVGGISLPYY